MAINLQDPFNLAGITDPAERNILLQGGVNRIDQTVPGGRIEYSGPGRSASTITLDPALQNIFDARTEAARSAANVAGGLITGLEGGRAGVEKAFYDKQIGLLSPTLDQNESRLKSRLLNRGLPESSEAYANAYNLQARDPRLRAYNDAALNAILSGGNELANTTTAARNLFNLDPNVGIPNTQSFTAPAAVDVTGAEQLKLQANVAANDAKLAADKIKADIEAGNFSALTTLGSAAITGLLTAADTSIGGKVASSILAGAASVGKSVYGFLQEHLGFGADAVTEAVQGLQQTAQIPPTGDFYPDLIPSGVFPSTDVPLPPAGGALDVGPIDIGKIPSLPGALTPPSNPYYMNEGIDDLFTGNIGHSPELITDPTVLGKDLTGKVNQAMLSDPNFQLIDPTIDIGVTPSLPDALTPPSNPYYMSEGIDDLYTGSIGSGADLSADEIFALGEDSYPGMGGAAGDLATSGMVGGGLIGAASGAMNDGLRGAFTGGVKGALTGGVAGGIASGLGMGALGATGIGLGLTLPMALWQGQQANKARTEAKQLYESAKFTNVIRGVYDLATGKDNFNSAGAAGRAEYSALLESVGLADPIGVTPDMGGANAASAGAAFLAKYPKLTPGTDVASLDDGNRLKGDARRATGRLAAIMRLPGMQENFDAFYNGKMSKEEFSSRSTAAVNKFKVDNAAKISSAAEKASNERILAMDVDPDGPLQDITAQRNAKASQVKYAAINAEAVVPEIAKAKQVATDLRAEAVAQQAAGIPYYDRGRAIQAAQNAEKRVAELKQYEAQQILLRDSNKPEMWQTVSYTDEDDRVRSNRYRQLLAISKGFNNAEEHAASEYDDGSDDE